MRSGHPGRAPGATPGRGRIVITQKGDWSLRVGDGRNPFSGLMETVLRALPGKHTQTP